jgi:superfamily II DNA or RNA helicase
MTDHDSSTEINLRPYQEAAIEGLRHSLKTRHMRPVLVSPTGSGKTTISAAIIKAAVEKGSRVLFLAPRRELIYQAYSTFQRFGLNATIIMAGEDRTMDGDVQVASKDTLHAWCIRSQKRRLPLADLIIVDEAHTSISKSYIDIFSAYPNARIIGLTATPAAPKGKGLGNIYDDIVKAWGVRELTEAGYLMPVRYFGPTTPDLENVGIRNGDYIEKDLDAAMDQPQLIGDIVSNWLRIASARRTVVFCVTRKHGRHICDEFIRVGVRAEYADGMTSDEERKAIFSRVASGETQVLVNVLIATFGVDIPPLDCAVLARPTKDLTLYLQCVGRILRPSPETGKTDAVVIDHAGAVMQHGYVDDDFPWSLDGKETVQERRERIKKEKKEPKEITCFKCKAIFKASHICPSCGHEMIPKGEALPVYEAELQEISRTKAKLNKAVDYDQKAVFYAQLKYYERQHGYKKGWSAWKYREMFDCWPNDKRVQALDPIAPTFEVLNWIKHQNIRRAKSRSAA